MQGMQIQVRDASLKDIFLMEMHYLFHRVVESLGLEGIFKGCLDQLPCNEQGHLQLHQVLRAPSSLIWSIARDGTSTTSLGNLCQCFTTLSIKTNKKLLIYM